MSQRDSGYERKERDLYETPAWVTWALVPFIPMRIASVWEPAAGSGKMVAVLGEQDFAEVHHSDISTGRMVHLGLATPGAADAGVWPMTFVPREQQQGA